MTNLFKPSRMKQRRNELGITLEELAAACDSSKSYMWELEKGKGEPGLTKAYLLAEALGVSMEWLCGKNDITNQYEYLGRQIANIVNKQIAKSKTNDSEGV